MRWPGRGRPELREMRLEDEIRHHIEERIDRLVEDGLDRAAAERSALESFGDVERVTTELKEIDAEGTRSARFLDGLWRDLAYAMRFLSRRPGFSAMTIGTLAVGIGAATAIFGLVNAVVLEPLPWPEPDRMVHVQQVAPDGQPFVASAPDFADLRDGVGAFEHLAAMTRSEMAVGGDEPASVSVARVTADYFAVFDGSAQVGRTFSGDDLGSYGGPSTVEGDIAVSGAPVAVLSHGLWQTRFGGRSDVVGSQLIVEGRPVTVVGVMPADWGRLLEADIWMPMSLTPLSLSREDHFLDVVGRLAPGTSVQTARAQAQRLANSLAERYPATNEGWRVRLTPFKQALLGEDRIRASWILLGAVGLLLALACVSVSNLLVARASTRGMEMSVRLALGAGRTRLIRQLLTESLVIGALASVAGLAVAFVLLPLLQSLTPADTPRIEAATMDASVAGFAIVVGLLTGAVFGLAPMVYASRRDPGSTLRLGRGTAGGQGERLRSALVAGQVALTVALLVGAGLLGTTFLKLRGADTGLPVERVWSVPLLMSGSRYTGEGRAVAASAIRHRLEELPGVQAAGNTNTLPFGGAGTVINIAVEGRPGTPESAPFVRWRAVSEGYFDAIDATALEGRLLEPADFMPGAEDVVVLGRSLARRVAGDDGSAVGRRIAMGWDGTNWRTVVGVVRDIEDLGPAEQPPLTFYLPGEAAMSTVVMLVRSAAGSTLDAGTIRDAIQDVEPGLPVPSVERLDTGADRNLAGERFYFIIVATFGMVALVLAFMGVYGVTQFSVAQRVREVCVRQALGARPSDVVRLLLGRSLVFAWTGVAAGLILALALSSAIESLLFDTSARDPLAFLAAATITAIACAIATLVPARRAARTAPAAVLST